MSYSFTITDSFNYSKDEILEQALDIAQREIEMQNLALNLLPEMTDFKEEGSKKTYSFTLVPRKELKADRTSPQETKSDRSNREKNRPLLE